MPKVNDTRLCLISANNKLGKEMKEMKIITYLQKKKLKIELNKKKI